MAYTKRQRTTRRQTTRKKRGIGGNGSIIKADGRQEWRDNAGKLHRDDGPAIISKNGAQEYWYHGTCHRVGGPAIVSADGRSYQWRHFGKLHRTDGPAVVKADGTREWRQDSRLHREDGPAIEYPNKPCGASNCKSAEYYRFGKKSEAPRSRIDENDAGQVEIIERPDGSIEWWLNGILLQSVDANGSGTVVENK